jgi:RNA polymerase sigma-70 factor (ECF subfamily)
MPCPSARGIRAQPLEEHSTASPEQATLRAQLRALLEKRLDELPVIFRTVFVMREIDDMSAAETAECLSIPQATVRTRLHRARALLRESLALDMDFGAEDLFQFGGAGCDRIVARVLGHLHELNTVPGEIQ